MDENIASALSLRTCEVTEKGVAMEKNVAYELHVPHKSRTRPSQTPQTVNPIYEDLKWSVVWIAMVVYSGPYSHAQYYHHYMDNQICFQ